MLPGMSGLDVCRELRRKRFEAPIIMLTARAEEVDRVVGLEIGGRRLRHEAVRHPRAARADPRAACGARPESVDGYLRFGEVEVDFDKHEATRARPPVELTGKEFEVLRLLAQHRGEIVTRERMLDEVWGYEHYPTTRTVDNHILRLRQKLEAEPVEPAPHPLGLRRRLQVRELNEVTMRDKE